MIFCPNEFTAWHGNQSGSDVPGESIVMPRVTGVMSIPFSPVDFTSLKYHQVLPVSTRFAAEAEKKQTMFIMKIINKVKLGFIGYGF